VRKGEAQVGLANFPVDLVLLGMIAAFLVLRLRSVLGKRTGYEREGGILSRPTGATPGRIIDVKAEPAPDRSARVLPDRDSPVGATLARIQAIDGSFSPARFLDGAEGAFRLIVLAFGKGDRAALRPLLTPTLMEVFDHAITERETAQHTQHTTLHTIRSASFEHATLDGQRADIAVKFVSDQVSYTNDAAGQTVIGTEALTEITDLWTFERELGSRDPAWRLAAAQSA
jgi:predicted lipid-binding transport protein (Tim44 family)